MRWQKGLNSGLSEKAQIRKALAGFIARLRENAKIEKLPN
jgi:hypothetical protein